LAAIKDANVNEIERRENCGCGKSAAHQILKRENRNNKKKKKLRRIFFLIIIFKVYTKKEN